MGKYINTRTEEAMLTPFKRCCIENFPFIEADFDALTNYELYCKVVEYLNKVINQTNINTEAVEYIKNYFDNLDVQEEINNKLDQMAIDGTLTDIIAQYLKLAGMLVYKTVSDMKKATNIENGSICKTLGYYILGDLGASEYIITNALDNSKHQELLDNGLYATLIVKNNTINIMQLGVKDNSVFINEPLNKALKLAKTVNLNKTDYAFEFNEVAEKESIFLNTGNVLNGNGAKIKITTPYNSEYYSMLYCKYVNDVTINDLEIDGSRELNSATTGEWGQGVRCLGSRNVYINNCIIHGCWGDSIKIDNTESGEYIDNICYINNCDLYDSRRQGVSVICCEKVVINNCKIHDIEGTNPQHGIDLEPNTARDLIKSVYITNNEFYNNHFGSILIIGLDKVLTPYTSNIIIKNNYCHDDNSFLNINGNNKMYLNVISTDNIIENVKITALSVTDHSTMNNTIYKNIIKNCKINADDLYNLIYINTSSDYIGDVGNILIDCICDNITAGSGNDSIISSSSSATKIKNTKIYLRGIQFNAINGSTNFDDSCYIKIAENPIKSDWNEAIKNYYYYADTLLLKPDRAYQISANNNIKKTVISNGGGNLTLESLTGNFPIFNKTSISTTQDGASITFYVNNSGKIFITNIVGTWQ